MKNDQYDIKRLGRIITLLSQMDEIIYNMDEKEYDRFQNYVYKRESILFPARRAARPSPKE